jgi:hypothetical protein
MSCIHSLPYLRSISPSNTDFVVNDLDTRGLLVDPRLYIARNRESSSPLVTLDSQLSRLGEQFLAFVAEPEMLRSADQAE